MSHLLPVWSLADRGIYGVCLGDTGNSVLGGPNSEPSLQKCLLLTLPLGSQLWVFSLTPRTPSPTSHMNDHDPALCRAGMRSRPAVPSFLRLDCLRQLPPERGEHQGQGRRAGTYFLDGSSWRLSGKEPACSAGDPGSIPGSGRSPGERNGHPLHPMDGGAWWATVHGVAESDTT